METLSHTFTYDNLGRLTRSEASDGETNTYGYDKAGNRTSWNVNGSEAGSSKLTAVFNEAGQLTSTTTTGANAGSASYSFDGAGNRSGQTVNGTATSFGHDPAGRLLSTQTEGRSTSYTYDGLDRRTSVTGATAFGSDTTSTTWDGLEPVATDSAQHGVTDLLRDPTGEVVFQTGAYDDAWVLGDARNTTATADAGGRITDLVDYTDFGAAGFESTGWASIVGNDGQPGDATLGLDHYYARDYDTTTGSWVQPDEWRGLLVRPQSLNRFAYVENSAVSFSDYLGFLPIGGGLKGGVAKAYAKYAVKKGGIAAAIGKRFGPTAPKHSMGTSGGGRPATLSRGGGSPLSGVSVPSSRSGQFASIVHLETPCSSAYFDRPCSTAPGSTWGPDVDPRVGGMILLVGGAILTTIAAACIIASVGACAAPVAVIAVATGSGTLAVAGTITVGGIGLAAGVAGVAGGTGIMLNAPRPTGGGSNAGEPKPASPNQLNQQINRGQAPTGIRRVDTGKVTGEQQHVHFSNGAALNIDGTWKHGVTNLTRDQIAWLQRNGWAIPRG